jgi:bifunctional ADP-heptose synthase (sugar kinase/adenylyltransferase)
VAVLALCCAAGADLETAVRLANHAAGIAVGKLGAATLTIDELRRAAL